MSDLINSAVSNLMETHLPILSSWCIQYKICKYACIHCAMCVCQNVLSQKSQLDFHEAWYWGTLAIISQYIPVLIKVKQQ
jgi:hypothetical protein